MSVKLLQPLKAASPIEFRDEGRSTDTRLKQPTKAKFSIIVTEEGITTDDRLVQKENTLKPIESSDEDSVTE